MLQSFYTGLSGMNNFSKTLDNVSNNIANMNTPGYRGTDAFMRSLNSNNDQGLGTTLAETVIRTKSGQLKQTGTGTDLAIAGQGMFVLRNKTGEEFYTRAGQFSVNADNVLVDSVSGMEVMSISSVGNLERVDITELKTLPPAATTEVKLSGNLLPTAATFEVTPVTIFDASGASHELKLEFNNPTTSVDLWDVTIIDSSGSSLGTGVLKFDGAGAPLTAFNSFSANLTFSGVTQAVSFNFGPAGSMSATTQSPGGPTSASTLGIKTIDGNARLGLLKVSFDSKGVMQLKYANGEVKEGKQIALASFSNEAKLEVASGGAYKTNRNMPAVYGKPSDDAYGSIQGGSIELSNVDLAQEFADIMIIQRGYQASSRAMTVSNELIEQLYNSTRG